MKSLKKILMMTACFSLALAFLAFAEEVKAPAKVPAVVAAPAAVPTPTPVEKTTLDNLQAAFNGEKNAHARYLAFAKKADEEGYGKVASLFRAASRAEQVHFERHAKLILALGAVPAAILETTVVKTTAENLETAMKGEIYESTVMYPEFLARAQKDKNKGAIDVFEDAGKAEAVHAGLYKRALGDLAGWKGKNQPFFVCPVCGNVMENMKSATCPICETSRRRFLEVQ